MVTADARGPAPDANGIGFHDNRTGRRFEVLVDGGVAGFTDYRDRDQVRSFVHTEVDPAYAGRGLASELIRAALDDARERDLAVLPICPFVRSFISRHLEYVTLVPDEQRRRFDLPAPEQAR